MVLECTTFSQSAWGKVSFPTFTCPALTSSPGLAGLLWRLSFSPTLLSPGSLAGFPQGQEKAPALGSPLSS